MCIMYWPMPVMNVVVPYYYLEAKVVNYLLLSDLPLKQSFHESGFCYFVITYQFTQQRILVIYRYLTVQVTLIALQDTSHAYASTLSAITAFNAFELRFVVRVLLHHRLRFNHLPLSRQYSIAASIYIRLITGCYCKCAFFLPYQEINYYCTKAVFLTLLHERIPESWLLVSIFI